MATQLNTAHGQEFKRQEIWDEIDMIYPIRSSSEIGDIANRIGADEEDVMNVLQSYESKKAEEKDSSLKEYVKDVLSDYFPSSVDKRLPTFEEFYNKFKSFSYDEKFSPEEVKMKFEELTKDPNQLSLFEVRKKIRNIIFEEFSKK